MPEHHSASALAAPALASACFFNPADVAAGFDRMRAVAEAHGYHYVHFNAAFATSLVGRSVPVGTLATLYSVIAARQAGEVTVGADGYDLAEVEQTFAARLAARSLQ